jgi:hypothetical protein
VTARLFPRLCDHATGEDPFNGPLVAAAAAWFTADREILKLPWSLSLTALEIAPRPAEFPPCVMLDEESEAPVGE